MVRVYFFLLSVLLTLPAQAVSIELQKAQVPFGEAVVVRIKTQENEVLQHYLQNLPREAWARDFVIELHTNSQNRAAYYLYAYEPGSYRLAQGGIFQGADVQVLPNSLIDVQWLPVASGVVYQKQAWPWEVKVKLNDPSLRVQLQGFIGSDLQSNPKDLKVDLQGQSLLAGDLHGTLRSWYQYELPQEGLSQGATRAYSPALQVDHGKRHPWKFFARPLEMQWKPLPGFLPPQVMIGAIHFQPQPLPLWAKQGDLLYWQWALDGVQMGRQALNLALLQMLAAQPRNGQLEWFAPEITYQDKDPGKVVIRVPIRLRAAGNIVLPQWTWRYFDTESGKLQVVTPQRGSLWSFASWQLYLTATVALGFVIGLLAVVTLVIHFYRMKRTVLRKVAELESTGQSQALWRQTERWLACDSIRSWGQWQQSTGVDLEVVEALQRGLYANAGKGKQPLPLDALCKELHKLNWTRRILRAYLKDMLQPLVKQVYRS
ncbi:hypothetical protein [Thiomicrorhabdus xiamenensis]|uniref:Oxygen tolerance n=1 Tax=Thiomicrorhabdus xiamenensis TaxID=2739063 RepID=A0A7D4NP35_9GAMM|nr:hypothetical protein [Thiomicrorhabdus xiamenensis]QKI88171.1 hypothetical protein HQN79_00580 [Thiomicrorhabdus xiamenensis]